MCKTEARAIEDPGLPRFIRMRSRFITWEAAVLDARPEGYAHFTSAKSMRCGSFAFFGKTRIAMSNDPVVSGVEAMR